MQFEAYDPDELQDDEEFLSAIPLDLIKQAIMNQFNDPIDNFKRDYVGSFIAKYNYSRAHEDEADTEELNLSALYNEFICFMTKLFEDNLSVGFPTLEDESEDIQMEMIQMAYRYFITRIKKNFVGVIMKYINDNIDFIMESLPKKRDVTTMNFEDIVDEADLRVLSNMDSVIELALEREYDVDEFLAASAYNNDSAETDFMIEQFNLNTLTGNFVRYYIGIVDDDLKAELASKIRNKILKKYPFKKSDIEE